MDQATNEIARDRLRRLLQFLKEFQRLKKPPVRNIAEYSWHLVLDRLPRHPFVIIGQVIETDSHDDAGAVDGLILRVRRPLQTSCPAPPNELKDWVLAGWQQIEDQPSFLDTRNVVTDDVTRTIRFDADERRVRARREWIAKREAWVIAETPAQQVEALYQRLYSLHGQLERESENVQLFLGDGLLRAKDTIGFVDHPVLLQKIELGFDPSKPEFSLIETDDPPELAMSLVSAVVNSQGEPLADTMQLAKCQVELSQNPRVHPLGGDETKGFLQRLINGVFAQGRFCERVPDVDATPSPVSLSREAVLFLAPRVGSFATAIDAALKRFEKDANAQVPQALANLVGVEAEDAVESGMPTAPSSPHPRSTAEDDLLLTRPANPEQEQLIRQLDRTGMVLVQGPPGTGKTHTIANLVGHALANGKTILITSHAAKALRVVREKIVDELQPLCVSLLETDAVSRHELQQAVNAIAQELGATSQDQLDSHVANLAAERDDLHRRMQDAEKELRQAVRDEYVDIIVGGEGKNPAQAARLLREWRNEHDWLPGPVDAGAVLPLTVEQVLDLYQTNALITPADERNLSAGIPETGRLFETSQFASLVARVKTLQQAKLDVDGAVWAASASVNRDDIARVRTWIMSEVAKLDAEPLWFRECVEAGMLGPATVAVWTGLIELIETTCQVCTEARCLGLSQQIHDLPKGWIPEDLAQVGQAIAQHLRHGGRLGPFTKLFHSSWLPLLDALFDGRQLSSVKDFEAIEKLAAAETRRRQLCTRWMRQLAGFGMDGSFESLASPEEHCRQHIPRLNEALGWYEKVGHEIERCLTHIGLQWSDHLNRQLPQPGAQPSLTRWLSACRRLVPILERRLQLLELRHHEQELKAAIDYLRSIVTIGAPDSVAQRLLRAVSQRDQAAYSAAMSTQRRLNSLTEPFRRRMASLSAIKKVASSWAAAIANRRPPHGGEKPPSDVSRAWLFRQWSQESNVARTQISMPCNVP